MDEYMHFSTFPHHISRGTVVRKTSGKEDQWWEHQW
jgi:hypothetical protein